MELEFRCTECKSINQKDDLSHPIACESCGKSYGVLEEKKPVEFCVICRCRDLYVQKDFNRKVGCAIATIGALLAPFTKLISLFVCALIDLVLYWMLPMISVCYRCGSIYRAFPKNPAHEGFNLGINDRYRAAERN
jgi:hypothetical protein